MKLFRNKSILYRYLASFVSIAMLCCVVIGVAGYVLAAGELRTSAAEEQQRRLQLAVEDMYAQFDHLEEISHYVLTTACYTPSYFSRNPYYELELLEDLAKQRTYAAIFDHLFLRYEHSPYVYTMTGKSWLAVFQKTILTEEDAATLPAIMDQTTELSFYPLSRGVMAIYPLSFARTARYSGQATLSFYLPHTKILERMMLVSSEDFTRVALFYNNECVLKTAEIKNPITVEYDKFRLVFDRDEIDAGLNNDFLRLSLWIIAFFATLMCAFATYIAIRNFRPIRNLARRHNLQTGTDEIENLDRTLSDIKGQLKFSQEQLNGHMMQFRSLRNDLQCYFAEQMIRGEADDMMLNRMREVGMHFPGNTFYAFVLRTDKKNKTSPLEAINELSDDTAAFYIAPYGGENTYAVVISTGSQEDWQAILREACTGAHVYGGEKTETVSEIPSLLFDAMTKSSPSDIKPSDIARCREDESLRKFRKALEAGDEADALEHLANYYTAYADGDDTMRQLIHGNIVSTLLSASYDANMSVPHAFLRGNYESWSMLEGWVSAVCGNKENAVQEHEEHEIIRYLRENALDNNLTLEAVAEHFHRSTRQITRIVQNETGGSYKDYVLRMRMERAKELLRQGCSVSETCEKVCYASRSHFIKTFTTYTGLTPSRFREEEA